MGMTENYRKAAKLGKSSKVIPKYPIPYVPILTKKDYTRGYIVRYFVKLKTSKNSIITEIKESDYKKYQSQDVFSAVTFFKTLFLRWKITGKREDVINGNTKTVEAKELLMPGISLTLGNRLQFWQDL